MKICNHCKRELPLSNFGFYKRNKDGYHNTCKDCRRVAQQKNNILHELEREKEDNLEKATGGIKVYILNHPKKGEKKFNICSTDEWFYNTDDRNDFLNYLKTRV